MAGYDTYDLFYSKPSDNEVIDTFSSSNQDDARASRDFSKSATPKL